MIAIIDYDAGNIKSVEKALLSLGQEVTVTAKQDEILGADKIVLPGVGAFGDAMENLRKRQLDAVIREAVEKEIPFLGICLGLQVLFEQRSAGGGRTWDFKRKDMQDPECRRVKNSAYGVEFSAFRE